MQHCRVLNVYRRKAAPGWRRGLWLTRDIEHENYSVVTSPPDGPWVGRILLALRETGPASGTYPSELQNYLRESTAYEYNAVQRA